MCVCVCVCVCVRVCVRVRVRVRVCTCICIPNRTQVRIQSMRAHSISARVATDLRREEGVRYSRQRNAQDRGGTCGHALAQVHMHTRVHVPTPMRRAPSRHLRVCGRGALVLRLCICICICMCICICICMWIYECVGGAAKRDGATCAVLGPALFVRLNEEKHPYFP